MHTLKHQRSTTSDSGHQGTPALEIGIFVQTTQTGCSTTTRKPWPLFASLRYPREVSRRGVPRQPQGRQPRQEQKQDLDHCPELKNGVSQGRHWDTQGGNIPAVLGMERELHPMGKSKSSTKALAKPAGARGGEGVWEAVPAAWLANSPSRGRLTANGQVQYIKRHPSA